VIYGLAVVVAAVELVFLLFYFAYSLVAIDGYLIF
jgi:hypothetical protein